MRSAILLIVLMVSGCVGIRYPGWEYVRIETEIPSAVCVYKAQEGCGKQPGVCYNWHKRRATLYDANTVVLAVASNERLSTNRAALADYYFCPARER